MRFLLSKLRIFLFFPTPYLSQPLLVCFDFPNFFHSGLVHSAASLALKAWILMLIS